ncbi:MAG: hypothetical protein ACHQ7M_05730 [Chloroflexota bacterium]
MARTVPAATLGTADAGFASAPPLAPGLAEAAAAAAGLAEAEAAAELGAAEAAGLEEGELAGALPGAELGTDAACPPQAERANATKAVNAIPLSFIH